MIQNWSDHAVLLECFAKLKANSRVYLDIGCGTAFNLSGEMIRDSILTVLVEGEDKKIQEIPGVDNPKNVILLNRWATPENIKEILNEYIGSLDITLLDLDIDSYDFELLETILRIKKPYIIMAETNEKIPYPIEFYVKYDHSWDTSHFYGMSFASFCGLVQEDYDIVSLNINNAFAIRKDMNNSRSIVSHKELYEHGYKNPRLEGKFPQFDYNSSVDCWLTMEPQEAIKQINAYFNEYQDKYYIGNNG